MSAERNDRPETNGFDYFVNQKKQLSIADRRPVIRKASDLVGPGIGAVAVRLSSLNDTLAQFNGYFSATSGTPFAPTSTDAYIGTVVSDAEIGGVQTFTNMTTEAVYQRVFRRAPGDPNTLTWGAWRKTSV